MHLTYRMGKNQMSNENFRISNETFKLQTPQQNKLR